MSQPKGADVPKPKGKLNLIVMTAVPLLLALGAGAGAYMAGLLPFGHAADAAVERSEPSGHGPARHATGANKAVQFVDLPDIIVNLDTGGQRLRFLKLKVALEVASAQDAERVLQLSPRVMDSFQLYLRALTPEDLNGATGLYRLKEELLARVNVAVGTTQVRDLLFKEMLVQ